MDDSISRRAAIDALEERLQANGYSNATLVSELNRCIGYLMRLPSADVQSVRHGQWIEDGYTHHKAVCNQCGEPCGSYAVGLPRDRYCKWCGAKMDEVKDEN